MSGCTARWFEWRRASLCHAVDFAVWGYDAKWILKRIQDKSVARGGREMVFSPLLQCCCLLTGEECAMVWRWKLLTVASPPKTQGYCNRALKEELAFVQDLKICEQADRAFCEMR